MHCIFLLSLSQYLAVSWSEDFGRYWLGCQEKIMPYQVEMVVSMISISIMKPMFDFGYTYKKPSLYPLPTKHTPLLVIHSFFLDER